MNYTFVLSENHAQLVLNALSDMPYKLAAEVINEIIRQVNEQKTQTLSELSSLKSNGKDKPVGTRNVAP